MKSLGIILFLIAIKSFGQSSDGLNINSICETEIRTKTAAFNRLLENSNIAEDISEVERLERSLQIARMAEPRIKAALLEKYSEEQKVTLVNLLNKHRAAVSRGLAPDNAGLLRQLNSELPRESEFNYRFQDLTEKAADGLGIDIKIVEQVVNGQPVLRRYNGSNDELIASSERPYIGSFQEIDYYVKETRRELYDHRDFIRIDLPARDNTVFPLRIVSDEYQSSYKEYRNQPVFSNNSSINLNMTYKMLVPTIGNINRLRSDMYNLNFDVYLSLDESGELDVNLVDPVYKGHKITQQIQQMIDYHRSNIERLSSNTPTLEGYLRKHADPACLPAVEAVSVDNSPRDSQDKVWYQRFWDNTFGRLSSGNEQ